MIHFWPLRFSSPDISRFPKALFFPYSRFEPETRYVNRTFHALLAASLPLWMRVRRACPPGWSGSNGWGCSCRNPAPAGGCTGCRPKTWSPWGRYLRRHGRGRMHTRVVGGGGEGAGRQGRDKAEFMFKKGEEKGKLTYFSIHAVYCSWFGSNTIGFQAVLKLFWTNQKNF